MGRAISIGHAGDDRARQAMLLFARQPIEIFDKPFGLDSAGFDEPVHDEAIDSQKREHFRADLFFRHSSLHPLCACLARMGMPLRQKMASLDTIRALARVEAGCDILGLLIRFGIDRPT